ncbi:hypothetical protein BN11_450020 [Nostocoides australiense Ben110]|uniref:Uncharacterized protein n=1 Tax=Nostocoides australiense Ben110 TaxID=1193182 RepID=W6JZ89_9MICO|nr:hypothetical protein BN11_450020 [Tetrasphaera australiensis Ben110]
MTHFQPTPLPLSPSLNRMLLADLPAVTEGFSGTQGNVWAIAWLMDAEPGLVARLRESGVDLPAVPSRTEVTPELMTAATRWPSALDLLLRAGPAAPGYDAASAVARRLGSALGALLVTLVTGPVRIRAQRPDWPSEPGQPGPRCSESCWAAARFAVNWAICSCQKRRRSWTSRGLASPCTASRNRSPWSYVVSQPPSATGSRSIAGERTSRRRESVMAGLSETCRSSRPRGGSGRTTSSIPSCAPCCRSSYPARRSCRSR